MSLKSPFARLLISIQDYLTEAVPALAWIDQDFGQLENYDTKPAVVFPCALVDFVGWTFEDAGPGVQIGTGQIQVRIAYAPFTNSSAKTPLAQKEKALSAYEVENDACDSLQGWSAQGFQALLRRSLDTERREDSIRVREARFSTSAKFYNETEGKKYRRVARPQPVVGGDLVSGSLPD